jgi:hypothetical protein
MKPARGGLVVFLSFLDFKTFRKGGFCLSLLCCTFLRISNEPRKDQSYLWLINTKKPGRGRHYSKSTDKKQHLHNFLSFAKKKKN